MLGNNSSNNSENLFTILASKYIPFWPLFLALFLLSLLVASSYLYLTTPKYNISAALIINDEKKGVDDSKIMESIDVFTSKKIVENEVEVLHSKELIKDVVYKLYLYASIYEDKLIKNIEAYDSSPVHIQLKDPNNKRYYRKDVKHFFSYNSRDNTVQIEGKSYPLDEWVKNPFGGKPIRFNKNSNYVDSSENKSFYFSFVSPKIVSDYIYPGLFVGSSSKLSTVVRINYEDAIPIRGEDIVNELIESYKNQSTRERDTLASSTLAFVDNRMIRVGEELREVEKELEQFKSSEGVVDISEQGSLYLNNVGNYDRRIGDIELQLAVLQKVKNYVVAKNKTAGIVPSTLGINDPILSQLLDKLYNAEIEYVELRKTTAENNPILVSLRNKIDQIRPGILENVNSQRANLRASLGNLKSSSGKYNSALHLLPEQERKLVEITRKKKSISELYDFLGQKREETALSYAPTQGEARIIEPAETSLNPVSPKKLIVYLIASFLSIAISLLIASRKELFSSKVLFRSEMERYSKIPILGELAFLDKSQENLLVNDHKDVFIIDQFRHLLSSLGLYQRSNKIKTLMITSSIAGEGKSYVSANLAQTIAFSGKKMALLDMDLRNARLSSIFKMENEKGISDFLSNKASFSEIIKDSNCAELFIIPSGAKTLSSSELLASQKLEELFQTLYGIFDYVVIDTPPISLVSDAAILSDFCDKTLVVVRHDYTPKYVAKRIESTLPKKNLRDTAIIFNSVKKRGIASENYGYGHGYGYDSIETEKPKSIIQSLIEFFRLRPAILGIKNLIQFSKK